MSFGVVCVDDLNKDVDGAFFHFPCISNVDDIFVFDVDKSVVKIFLLLTWIGFALVKYD